MLFLFCPEVCVSEGQRLTYILYKDRHSWLLLFIIVLVCHSSYTHTAIMMRGSCTYSPPPPLCVNVSEAERGEISLQHWYTSGDSIRAAVLENRTSQEGAMLYKNSLQTSQNFTYCISHSEKKFSRKRENIHLILVLMQQ